MGLSSGEVPGVLLVRGSAFTSGLANALEKMEVRVLITDPNRGQLRAPREAGVPTYYGDLLSEAADSGVEFISYSTILAASDNDAYNTLVATDFAPQFGRDSIWQLARVKEDRARHSLPSQLGGQVLNDGRTLAQYLELLAEGWVFRTTRLTEEYSLDDWKEAREGAIPLATLRDGQFRFIGRKDEMPDKPNVRIVSLIPPDIAERIRKETEEISRQRELARSEAEAVRKGEGNGSQRDDDDMPPPKTKSKLPDSDG